MTITIHPSAQIVEVNGVACRVWTGTTDRGTRCDLFIARVMISKDEPVEAQAVFTQELKERQPPRADGPLGVWPARLLFPDEDT